MAIKAMMGFDETVSEELSGAVTTRATGRTGTGQSLQINSGTPTLVVLPVGVGTMITGFGYLFTAAGTGNIISYLEGATTHIQIVGDGSGNVVVKRGAAGTTLGTSSGVVMNTINTWYYVEVKVVISDTVGVVVVKINGTTVLNLTGQDTRNAGTTGLIDNIVGNRPGGSGAGQYDDVVVLDDTGSAPYNDFLGDVTVATLLPTAAGDSTQWTASTGTNVAAVDETPPNTTDYVAASSTGLTDLYQVADMSQTTGTVLAVQVQTYTAKSDAGTSPVVKGKLKAVTTGTQQTDSTQTPQAGLSTTYVLGSGDIHTTDPDGAAWSIAKVNGLQVGMASA